MIPRILVVTCAVALIFCGLAAGSARQNTQSTSSQSSATATKNTASGTESVTGCVAREGDEFVLKTDNGTYEFNTSRDLTPYLGKKVQISGHWTATGITTAAPAEKAAAAPTEAPAESAGSKTAAPQKFVGDLHLHITGAVIGDCASSQ